MMNTFEVIVSLKAALRGAISGRVTLESVPKHCVSDHSKRKKDGTHFLELLPKTKTTGYTFVDINGKFLSSLLSHTSLDTVS